MSELPNNPPPTPDENPATEKIDVAAMHAPILREQRDPRDGYEPIPIWLVSLFGVLLFWGGWYLANYSGGWNSAVLDERPEARFPATPSGPPAPVDPVVLGKRIFTANCVVCHQATGSGVPGQYPPLAGSEWVLTRPAQIKRIVLHGFEGPVTVKNITFNSAMPPFGLKLSDAHIAAVLTYVRTQKDWGNNASPISPEDVAATRAATKSRTQPWSQSELLAITHDESAPATQPTTKPK